MNDFQYQLQQLPISDFQTSAVVPWDQTQYVVDDTRQFLGGCIGIGFGFGCFSCFGCFGCGGFGRCGRCGGCGRCGRCGH